MKIWATVPDEWEKPLIEISQEEGFEKISKLVYEIIRQELKRRGYIGRGKKE